MNSEPYEPEAVIPTYFLIEGPMRLLPAPDMLQEVPRSFWRWKHVQHLLQMFWRKWYSEYLPQCQILGKWVQKKLALKINDIVVMKEDNIPLKIWKLGRITEVHLGADSINRVATVRTSSGTEIKRSAVKHCVLSIEDNLKAISNPVENHDFVSSVQTLIVVHLTRISLALVARFVC